MHQWPRPEYFMVLKIDFLISAFYTCKAQIIGKSIVFVTYDNLQNWNISYGSGFMGQNKLPVFPVASLLQVNLVLATENMILNA